MTSSWARLRSVSTSTTAVAVAAIRSPVTVRVCSFSSHTTSSRSLRSECGSRSEDGDYGVGFVFLSRNDEERTNEQNIIEEIVTNEDSSLGWRDVLSAAKY